MNEFTHFDDHGNAVMVDVGAKESTERLAVACASVVMQPETLKLIADQQIKKGDVLTIAQIAGIMGAKKTSELIPLCHPIGLTSVRVLLKVDEELPGIRLSATCNVKGQTGVEMEALTAVSISALTIYDMCKAVDRGMRITDIRLERKQGGKSGNWQAR